MSDRPTRFPLLVVLLLGLCGAQAVAADVLDAQVVLNAYQGLVEEHLSGVMRSAAVIARTHEARSGRWQTTKPLLDAFSADLGTDATVFYARPDGSYYSTENGRVTDQNLKDRPYFAALMAGRAVLGELVISKSTGHRSIIVATPVTVEGRVVAAVGVSVRARLLSQWVDATLQLPADWYFYALNASQQIALHRNMDRLFRTPTEVGDEALGEAFAEPLRQERGEFAYTLDGKRITTIFQRSSATGWHFFLAR